MNKNKRSSHQHDESMWKGATQAVFLNARKLRTTMTKAEELLWESLKGNKLNGQKFRRQHPVGVYIADFYNHKNKLVIEIDGDYHDTEEQQLKDIERTKFLEYNGLRVIRFKNEEVVSNLNYVLERIKEELFI
ncbi:MAG: DUF559 domain-containing protein [Flavobacterium sp.]|nr:DUF559 domain-containing protein [Flavobacterium sp.]